MDFGKVDHPENVNFDLPENGFFGSVQSCNSNSFYLGASEWASKGFVGTAYPEKTNANDFLQAYSRQFNTVELNATYYKIPTAEVVSKWLASVSNEFRFCPKFSKAITMRKDFFQRTDQMDRFLALCESLGDNLGVPFYQFPSWFSPAYFDSLQLFCEMMPSDLNYAVEIRHPGWYESADIQEKLCSLLHKHQISWVITDVAGRRDVMHMSVTCPNVFIRFNTYGDLQFNHSRLEQWANRLETWYSMGLESCYFFIHNPLSERIMNFAVPFSQKIATIPLSKTSRPAFQFSYKTKLF